MNRTRTTARVVALGATLSIALTACGGGGGGFDGDKKSGTAAASQSGPVTLKMLVASSTDTELGAVKKATEAWAKKTGNTVQVQTTSDLPTEIAKGFAGGTPNDLFYVDPMMLGTYAEAGNLYAYGDQVESVGYVDSLKKQFTYDGKFQCAPKDFSTLGLVINEDLWKKAGMTDADIPKDWAGLEKAAKKLTSGSVTGLVVNPEYQRLGAFMAQAGGKMVSDDGKTATVNSAENKAGLDEAQKMLKDGSMKFSKQVDAGWGGEALIKGKAAMVIEGNWIRGALAKDAPNMKIKVAELPTGPKGKGTMTFTNCWGIAAKSKNQAAAVDLVKFLGSDDQQLAAAKAFGVMPSTKSALEKYKSATPQDAGFYAGADYATGVPTSQGFDQVLKDFNASLESLASADTKKLLDTAQKNAEASLKN